MKSIIIPSNSSGGGKTIITLGITKALQKGYEVQPYKPLRTSMTVFSKGFRK